jgi:ubiquinone/menaquinone biosynthesis C-methylase UbiE
MKMKDPYRRVAGIYDRLFDNMNKGLKLAGIRMFRPSKGMNILDVGCGTGSHLELYKRYKCNLYGIDMSPSMLKVARERLGSNAQLTDSSRYDREGLIWIIHPAKKPAYESEWTCEG